MSSELVTTPPRPMRLAAFPAVVLALVLAALGTSSARAEIASSSDATHDVKRSTRAHPAQATPVPGVAFLDVTGVRVAYTRNRIRAVVQVRRLDHSRATYGMSLHLQFGSSRDFRYADTFVRVRHGHWGGRVTQSIDTHTCAIDHTIDYRRDRISVSFPASCLDTPRWVRAQILAVSTVSSGVYDFDYLPRQHGQVGRYGPRVHRG